MTRDHVDRIWYGVEERHNENSIVELATAGKVSDECNQDCILGLCFRVSIRCVEKEGSAEIMKVSNSLTFRCRFEYTSRIF